VFLVGTANIQEVVSASAGQQAILPGVESVITVKYNNGNNVLTGAYLVGQTVATLTTSINA
jgi:nickel-dependent lactate racemase